MKTLALGRNLIIALMFLLVGTLCLPSDGLADLDSGLVAYWSFDDGTATDISGHGNHGIIYEATSVPGACGYGLNFDGQDDHILVPDAPSLDLANSFTLAGWIERKGPGSCYGISVETIVSKHYTHWKRSYLLGLRSKKGNLELSNQSNWTPILLGTTVVNDNQWYHVCGTYDYQTGKYSMYVNGVLERSMNVGQQNIMQTSIPVVIGAYAGSDDGSRTVCHFNGVIDEVRIYNRALSDAEIESLAHLSSSPHIVSTSPAQNQLNVSVNTNIEVTFDVDMNETSINESTFVIFARSTGLHQGTISYDGVTRTATFDPFSDFDEGEVITAVLTTDIKSSHGIPLDNSHVWSFTTLVIDGGACFASDSTYPVGGYPKYVIAADLDNDEDLDLATADADSSWISVLLNDGHGTFALDSMYPIGGWLGSVFAADLDKDGDLDLAVANHDRRNVFVFLNNGNGTFALDSAYPVGNTPYSVFAADLDGDGDLDLAVGTYGYSNISILLNNGDATFGPYSAYHAGSVPYQVIAADLDADGDMDLATANVYSDNVSVLMNNGDGSFAPHSVYPVGSYPNSVCAADIDNDGYLDLAIACMNSNNVWVLFNDGSGGFPDFSIYPTGDRAYYVAAGDLDSDADLELVVANFGSHNISVLVNNGDGTFADQAIYRVGSGPHSVFLAGLDGDGDLDIAVSNAYSDDVTVLLNHPCYTPAEICKFFLTPKKLNLKRNAEHTFMIHLHPCEPMDVSKGDSAEVYVDVDGNDTFDNDERYPAVVNSPSMVIKVYCEDLVDNDPKVAIYSVNNIPISDTLGNDIIMYLDTFNPKGKGTKSIISPAQFTLSQNYPNPFNPETEISYVLPNACQVKLSIYNLLGQRIRILVDEYQATGHQTAHWDGTDEQGNKVTSGIYFYRIQAGEFTDAKKMILMK